MSAAPQKDSRNRASFPEDQSPFIKFDREICANLVAAESREWLVTNGLGSFASGTISGILTRRYHGLLVAALDPPRKRTLLVTKIDEIASLGGTDFALGANRWSGGAIDPKGFNFLESFWLEGTVPVWKYQFGGAILEKRVWMQRGANTTFVEYRMNGGQIILAIKVLVNYRDLHGTTRAGDWQMNVERCGTDGACGLSVTAFDGATPFYLLASANSVELAHDWYYNYDLAMERERGLGDTEDHLHAATFRASLQSDRSVTLAFTTDATLNLDAAGISRVAASLAAEQTRARELIARMQSAPSPKLLFVDGSGGATDFDSMNNALASLVAAREPHRPRKLRKPGAALPSVFGPAPEWIQQLACAADQFLVEDPSARDLKTKGPNRSASIIAGYPWFGVWSRDAVISVCGLALTTGRTEFARNLIKNCASQIVGGMLPNAFPENGEPPEFNTADSALWFIEAARQYVNVTDDLDLAREIFPAMVEIVRSYSAGTRFNIHADPADGLLYAGESNTNLTWMDARVDGRAITPRIGKPVEVNALWMNTLYALAKIAQQIGRPRLEFQAMAKRARDNFERFWNPVRRCCFDVLDGPDGNDASVRPNQIFAVSLPVSALTSAQQIAVVESCTTNLLTPFGLRSLAPNESGYARNYTGPEEQRAAAYHQGTIWAWLLGPFALAHFRVYRDRAAALRLFDAIPEHMKQAGLGSISEVFDAEPPFIPRGCPAQAWSVGEILRAWISIRASAL
jgi:glycogen debranching enzyme